MEEKLTVRMEEERIRAINSAGRKKNFAYNQIRRILECENLLLFFMEEMHGTGCGYAVAVERTADGLPAFPGSPL